MIHYFLKSLKLFGALSLYSASLWSTAQAEDFILPLYDEDDYYVERLLTAALKAADGTHTLKTEILPVSQSRLIRALTDGATQLNVFYSGHSRDRENTLLQIDIPLTRGLLGYRLLAIREKDAGLFQEVATTPELAAHVTLGSGIGWPDTDILRAAGFQVVTGPDANLWQMLARGRYQAFPRGLHEVMAELRQNAPLYQEAHLMTEKTVMLQYLYDQFFYVAPQDTVRAAILQQGLTRLYENGTFMQVFNSDPTMQAALAEVTRHKRHILHIENPLNSDRIKAIPAKFWHNFDSQVVSNPTPITP